jgi:DNA-binding transcriptional LysR family regulator
VETDVLRWFQEVADGTTVTEVSEVHRVSQPAVSRALARLEKEVGTALFRKSGRVLRLTLAGVTFKRHIDALIHNLDDGIAAVNQLVDPETGTVDVAFQLSLGSWLVPETVAGFRTAHPHVHFRLTHSDDTLGSSMVADGRVDMEFTSRRPRNPAVTWRRLFSEPLLLATPPGHPLGRQPTVWLAAAAEEDFIVLPRLWALRGLTDQLCAGAGFQPRVAFEAEDLSTVRGFVAAGLGVAVLPAMGENPAERLPGAPTLTEIADPRAFRDIGVSWSAERRLLPAAELFRRYAISSVRRPTQSAQG